MTRPELEIGPALVAFFESQQRVDSPEEHQRALAELCRIFNKKFASLSQGKKKESII